VLTWTLGVIGTSLLWWWTARLMVRGEIRWRALLPTAVLTGIGSSFYTIAGSIWMPAHVANQYRQFGTFGIALAFVTWLTGLAFVLVFAAVLGPALADGDDALGRWMRSNQPTAVEPGSLPALPGPSRPMRLSDAFGRGAGGSGVTLSAPVAPVAETPGQSVPTNPVEAPTAQVPPAAGTPRGDGG
jgi:membrane protein